MMPELPGAVPEIPVSDIHVAVEYYRDRLRFDVDWVADDISLAGVSRDRCRLFLAGPLFRQGRGTAGPLVTWLNMSSRAEVDALHAAWMERKALLRSAPEAMPWNLYEFTAADDDGNLFRVFYDFGWEERASAQSG